MNDSKQKQPRVYKRITSRTVALHEATAVLTGNNTEAVRRLEPEYSNPNARAVKIVAKSSIENTPEYIDTQLQQIGSEAIDRIGELVHSDDERIATKNSHYVVDHLRGKAVQRSISVTGRLNIQSVLD